MKKNVLALSITAALVGFGFAGGAQAAAGSATSLALSADGIGHILLVPYFSAQGANHTLLNITNTSTVGKAVKVRFRGAANSDDVYDFQVFMSPQDVWTADVAKGADGRATLTTADNSCTKPVKATLNSTPFVTSRVDSTLTGDALANQTREGYVEILAMADITAPLAAIITHSQTTGLAGCTGASWSLLDTWTAAGAYSGLTNPTSGLMANWIIINTTDAGAWSGEATAVAAISGSAGAQSYATGNIVYWPQTGVAASSKATVNDYTADPLFRGSSPVLAAGLYDLPDLSTPYYGVVTPEVQASALSYSLATRKVINEYLTNSGINATTDWVMTSVTRRYSVALDYASEAMVYTDLTSTGKVFYDAANTTLIGRQICVTGISPVYYNQEEYTPVGSEVVVISPSTPASPLVFCGEANVLAFNTGGSVTAPVASGTLKATVARSYMDVGTSKGGWMNIATPGTTTATVGGFGLPIQGSAFLRASAGVGTYGVTWDHRFARPALAF